MPHREYSFTSIPWSQSLQAPNNVTVLIGSPPSLIQAPGRPPHHRRNLYLPPGLRHRNPAETSRRDQA